MKFYDISNLDIKMTYIANENRQSKDWMNDIFVQTKFFADARVKKYKKNLKEEDYTQEAYLGLWEAIITYDYQKNFDFYRWAQWNISKKLRDYSSKSKRVFAAKSSIKEELNNCKYYCFSEEQGAELEDKIFYKMLLFNENNILSDKERIIIVDNLVLGKKLNEIARDFDLSSERIRQIRNCSLRKIKHLLS